MTNLAAVGVIMAGGSGRRMRESGELTPKPLVEVLGAPLVERNLVAMLRAQLSDIRVVISDGPVADPIRQWAAVRGVTLAAAAGARLAVVSEERPLGNCGGIVRAVSPDEGDALLVFADNLTDLDLRALIRTHATAGAELTLAIHTEPFRLPYGVVDVRNGAVTGYREKPSMPVTVASGLVVLSARARSALDGPAGVADMTNAVVARSMQTTTFPHDALWMDVNDAAKVAAATEMVRSAPARFEQFWPRGSPETSSDTWHPAMAGSRLVIDDIDQVGNPVRVDVAQVSPDEVSVEGWRRVVAWRSEHM